MVVDSLVTKSVQLNFSYLTVTSIVSNDSIEVEAWLSQKRVYGNFKDMSSAKASRDLRKGMQVDLIDKIVKK